MPIYPSPWGAPYGVIERSVRQSLQFSNNVVNGYISLPFGVTLNELVVSRSYAQNADGFNLTRVFHIAGSDNPPDLDGVGPQLGELFSEDTRFIAGSRELEVLNVAVNAKACRLTVVYATLNQTQSGVLRSYTLDVGSQTEHVSRALEQSNFSADDDDSLLIGVTDEAVEGVDISAPYMRWTETAFRTSLTNSYARRLMELHSKVNGSSFRGFPAFSVRFDGATAQRNSNSQWEIQYKFSINPETSLEVTGDEMVDGNSVSVDPVFGWQYVWFRLQKLKNDETPPRLIEKIKSVHVADVYETDNFADLEIGIGVIS